MPAGRPRGPTILFGVSTPLKNVIYHNNVRATLTWSSTGCSVVPMEIEFDAAASEFDDALTAAGKEEADSVAHALLRNKLHRFSDDGGPDRLHRFSDDSAWGSAVTAAAPVADDTAKLDGPKVPHDGAAAQDAISASVRGVWRTAVAVLLVLIAPGVAFALVFWIENHIAGGAANDPAASGGIEVTAIVGFEPVAKDESTMAAAKAEHLGEGETVQLEVEEKACAEADAAAAAEAAEAEAARLEAEEEARAETEDEVATAETARLEADEETRADATAEAVAADAAPLEVEEEADAETEDEVATAEAARLEAEEEARA